jgi:hypothetical protein
VFVVNQGYVRISAMVLGPGDDVPRHLSDDTVTVVEEMDGKALLPSSLKLQGYHLYVRVYLGQQLPRMDVCK